MVSKHTPGPWSATGKQVVSGTTLVAVVDNEDDAPIVAAAPDMFAALSLAEPVLDTYHTATSGGAPAGRIWYVLQAVRDALARAGS